MIDWNNPRIMILIDINDSGDYYNIVYAIDNSVAHFDQETSEHLIFTYLVRPQTNIFADLSDKAYWKRSYHTEHNTLIVKHNIRSILLNCLFTKVDQS